VLSGDVYSVAAAGTEQASRHHDLGLIVQTFTAHPSTACVVATLLALLAEPSTATSAQAAGAAFRRSLVASAPRARTLAVASGGVIAPTGCRVATAADGSVVVTGPGTNGALTCHLVLSWSPRPGAVAYETVAGVAPPCTRARGGSLGHGRELVAIVVSPFDVCAATYVVYALGRAPATGAPVRVDSTAVLHIRTEGSRRT